MRKTSLGLLVVCLFVAPAVSDTPIVDENFDSYTNQSGYEANWQPDAGDGITPVGGPHGIVVPDTTFGIIDPPNDDPPDLQGGGGVAFLEGINEWQGSTFDLLPTEIQSIRYGADIFNDGVVGNWKQMVGLRNDTIDRDPDTFGIQAGLNFLEMGFINFDTCDPTVEGCDTSPAVVKDEDTPGYAQNSQFAYRLTLFNSFSLGNVTRPDYENGGTETLPLLDIPEYQNLRLSPALDLEENGGNGDGFVDIDDIGEGWHTFTATITPTTVTIELDLRRNGINEITGLEEPDAFDIIEIEMAEDPANAGVVAGFTSLRTGPPSGSSGNAWVVFDNVFLTQVDVETGGVPGDYNENGVVDAADYVVWLAALGATSIPNEVNPDGIVDQADYAAWKERFGETAGSGALSGNGSIPEPASIVLMILAASALFAQRKKAKLQPQD